MTSIIGRTMPSMNGMPLGPHKGVTLKAQIMSGIVYGLTPFVFGNARKCRLKFLKTPKIWAAQARSRRRAQPPLWPIPSSPCSHPRCANCHSPDDHSRWGSDKAGTARIHPMNFMRGADSSGLGNMARRIQRLSPPRAANWHLAPVEKIWFGKSSAEICAQIKDLLRNGNLTLTDIAKHVKNDALVAWGWTPGPGREPAPGSIDETYANLIAWTSAGAPCPQ